MAASKSMKPTTKYVSNHHAGNIMIPRALIPGKVNIKPIILVAGVQTPVDAEEWKAELASNKMLQNYLDAGLLSVGRKRAGPCPVQSNTTAVLPIPEHLKTDEELVEVGSRVANVKKANVTEITL